MLNPDFKRYENAIREVTSIERKLNNPRVPGNKKEKLQFRLQILKNQIIPKFENRIFY
jgi:hypothetical protein